VLRLMRETDLLCHIRREGGSSLFCTLWWAIVYKR
jgi:hypothetical protein